jgi:hypothetical protein
VGGGVSGDGGEKVVALEGVEAGVDGGGNGGGAGDVVEERDLAEVVVFVRGGVVVVGSMSSSPSATM